MVSGVVAVFIYARRLPHPAATAGSPPVPPPKVPAPMLPPPVVPAPDARQAAPGGPKAPARPAFTPPAPFIPFPEDAQGPIPVAAGHPMWGTRSALVTLTLFG